MSEIQRSNGPVPKPGLARGIVSRVVALGYYDGPTNGLLEYGGSGGAIYKFDLLELLPADDGDDLRIFSLAALPAESMAEFVQLLAPYQGAQWPLWCPLWSFPSEEVRRAMEEGTDRILQRAACVEWVVASTTLPGAIMSARTVTPQEVRTIPDLPAFLGLGKQPPWLLSTVVVP